MNEKELICIACPLGCRLTVMEDTDKEKGYSVTGNKCNRGAEYAIKEMVNPTRILTSTVKVENGLLPRIPVRTDDAIPKTEIFTCMEKINKVVVKTPIKKGDIIIKDITKGVNLVASRSM